MPGLVSRCLSNLVGGVSEQPAVLRSDGQADLVENCTQTAFGFSEKRPGTLHLANITSQISTPNPQDCFFGANFSDGTAYLFYANSANGYVYAYDPFGNLISTLSGCASYLTVSATNDPVGMNRIKSYQEGDTIYLTNPTVKPAMLGTTSSAFTPAALVWIETVNPPGSPGCIYSLTVDGFTGTCSDYNFAQNANWGSSDVATTLAQNLVTAMGVSASLYTVSVNTSYIYIQRANNGTFTCSVTDTKGGTWAQLLKNSAQLITQLPTVCQNGMQVTITGAEGSGPSSWYYVKFQTTDGVAFGPGKWVECVGPSVATSIDATTMPCIITKSGTITSPSFNIAAQTWGQRVVGDTTTAPTPSFIGSSGITDIFFFVDRLGFVCGGNRVVLSMTGEYTQFFPLTVVAGQTADDPIDLSVDIQESANIYHATPSDQGVILWGNRGQYALSSATGTSLSPSTAQCPHLTSFECHPACKPVAIGRNYYFLSPPTVPYLGYQGSSGPGDKSTLGTLDFLKAYEFYWDWQAQNNDAVEVAGHCPTLLRSVNPRMVAAPKHGAIFEYDLASNSGYTFKNDPTKLGLPTLRVYRFLNQGGQKVQSSWTTWYFDELLYSGGTYGGGTTARSSIAAATVLNGYLFMVVYRGWASAYGPGMFLEAIPLDRTLAEYDSAWNTSSSSPAQASQEIHLDRKVRFETLSPSYSGGLTTITLPYKLTGIPRAVLWINGAFVEAQFQIAGVGNIGSTTIQLTGNYAAATGWVGQQFTSRLQPSQQFVKDYRGHLDTSGRVQYMRWQVTYENTGYLGFSVQSGNRSAKTGAVVGSEPSTYGSAPSLQSGQASFPVLGRSTDTTIQLISTSWMPFRIATLEWWANYFTPYQRIL